ncbi:PTS system IIA component (Gat family) [Streptohalobacillus salinus]|uniref:PTS system IIA component (Gat family) n=1 Tax=Streptohalobacillus salinus TaxID=621096 RepID=A0A2V3VYM9_9BACI|nr:PTS sugar transporter subunit IIA [Streptohalobacillus salinus]PXW86726.1 PTS system IIA component (Gat family) [Streptohalobacillus salinus]
MSNLNFDESLILKDIEARTKEEVIGMMANNLIEKKLVKESYRNAVIQREQDFATGLPTAGVSVAIPHTDIEHVNQKAISIGILKEPVLFEIMGDSETTPVKLVFMLAMDEEHSQLELLQRLMQIFQDADFLMYLSNETDKTKIKEKVTAQLDFSLKGGE